MIDKGALTVVPNYRNNLFEIDKGYPLRTYGPKRIM